ncbi:cache domain-containing sensor histidine kinase [Clostridium tertium]|uniref:cache domain-containing sensor histidine kinase n=1 Tax=Clostridium tertium TaxID=1559 RepID=UPI0024B347BC|nr:sensor histidine kinase [Clostridium tertium]MDI9217149.1 histidine kinase [Clostridium tertium]
MKGKFYYSQKTYLFFFYGLLVTILLSIFFIYFYSFYKDTIINDAKVKSESLCKSIQNSLNNELSNISTISMNIVYSNAIKKNFTNFSNHYESDEINTSSFSTLRENVLSIYDIITAIIGTFQSATQVNLYTLNGTCIGSGYFQGVTQVNLDNLAWYEPTINKNGYKHISQIDTLPNNKNLYLESPKYLTLTRLFYNNSNEPEGIVEVIQDCNTIFSLILELQQKNPYTSFYIYNENNELIYPYIINSNDDINYLNLIKENSLAPSSAKFIKTNDNNEFLISYEKLEQYDWRIIISEPKSFVLESLYSFKISFLVIIFISVCCTLVLCFIISSRITSPLSKLSHETIKVTLNNVLSENKSIISPIDSNIEEISELYIAFINMYNKLRDSSHEILLLKSEETKAKLQATQSFINPHFLYNSLTNISIMAEENMNEDIIRMCDALCSYSRYITTSYETIVPLIEEVSSTEQYIECMKIRYGSDFIYQSDINEDTNNIFIPKLVIQPFVENAFKYGFSTSPPWYLKISSFIENGKWVILIEDNGGCLSSDKREELISKFNNIDKSKELSSFSIGGMGLKNVYIRLKLLYEDESIFRIDNSTLGKTVFIIGGPIYRSKEEFYNDHTQI